MYWCFCGCRSNCFSGQQSLSVIYCIDNFYYGKPQGPNSSRFQQVRVSAMFTWTCWDQIFRNMKLAHMYINTEWHNCIWYEWIRLRVTDVFLHEVHSRNCSFVCSQTRSQINVGATWLTSSFFPCEWKKIRHVIEPGNSWRWNVSSESKEKHSKRGEKYKNRAHRQRGHFNAP